MQQKLREAKMGKNSKPTSKESTFVWNRDSRSFQKRRLITEDIRYNAILDWL